MPTQKTTPPALCLPTGFRNAADPRAEGYRALGANRLRPRFFLNQFKWYDAKNQPGAIDADSDLPSDWFRVTRKTKMQSGTDPVSAGFETRGQAEGAAASAFEKLPPKRRAELLAGKGEPRRRSQHRNGRQRRSRRARSKPAGLRLVPGRSDSRFAVMPQEVRAEERNDDADRVWFIRSHVIVQESLLAWVPDFMLRENEFCLCRRQLVLTPLKSLAAKLLVEPVGLPCFPVMVEPVCAVGVVSLLVFRVPIAPVTVVVAPVILQVFFRCRLIGRGRSQECRARQRHPDDESPHPHLRVLHDRNPPEYSHVPADHSAAAGSGVRWSCRAFNSGPAAVKRKGKPVIVFSHPRQ